MNILTLPPRVRTTITRVLHDRIDSLNNIRALSSNGMARKEASIQAVKDILSCATLTTDQCDVVRNALQVAWQCASHTGRSDTAHEVELALLYL